MKIALVGYGKMGHMIEQAAKRAGHEVVTTIDVIADDAAVHLARLPLLGLPSALHAQCIGSHLQ